ncbi:MAG: VPLPA-CTERM-specific exosortase XrtD [Pseudomonadota bacterium]
MTTQTSKIGGDRNGVFGLVALVVALLGLLLTYFDGLKFMVGEWSQEEYSHGYLIPAIAFFLLWQQRKALFDMRWRGAWSGFAPVLISTILFLMGELSALYVIIQYAFLGSLIGLILAAIGWRGMRYAWAPLLYLCFMIPLPDFLYNNLSAKLQLISSELGVAVIRFFDISVFLEGNVIDLGSYQLQVVEACSGLRYLFPLMSFGFLLAYMFKGPMWQRAIIFLITIPITVLMNSFRIGVIGVLVDRYGPSQAEGFLHDFEGWIIFMACVGILLLLMKVFMMFSKEPRSLRDTLSLDSGEDTTREQITQNGVFSVPFFASVALILATAIGSTYLDEREEIVPERERFTAFDMTINEWTGTNVPIESVYLDVLKLEDYLSAQFDNADQSASVNVWVAYYSTQRKGVAIHSPRTCLPGGGWKIETFETIAVDRVPGAVDETVNVNRTIMTQDKSRLLVYYWFKQRERNLTNEYAQKWYLFWDSLTRKRTDGALMRLIVSVPEGTDLAEQENRLQQFMRESYAPLVEYVPD